MFLLQCLAVTAVVFWVSAAAAALLLRSAAERDLRPGVRVGFGFMLVLAYFSAAWQVASITQAWIAGLALAALYAWGRFGRPGAARAAGACRELWRDYRRAFAGFLVGALAFFAPLVATWNFGPFTEGGGDVSIYADTTKYLVDRDLTEFGLPSRSLDDLAANLREVGRQGGGVRVGADKSPLANPPAPEYPAHRIVYTRTMSPFLYAQFATFSFLSGATNYHVYYGIQAFVYAALLMAAWSFFARYGPRVALAGVVLTGASHGLVSIFYNTYSAQGIALLTSALVVAALAHVRIPSWAALRTYGAVLLVTWITYVHYLAVLLPMAMVALVAAPAATAAAAREPLRWPGRIAAGVFAAACASLAWAGMLKSVEIALVLTRTALTESQPRADSLLYMGMPIRAFGTQWLAFVSGIASQQHFLPFVKDYPWVPGMLQAGAFAAAAAFALGLVVMARWALARRGSPWRPVLHDAGVYVAALFTIAIHLVLVRTSLYTQAKGAQNILVLVYVVLLLPLALAWRDLPRTPGARALEGANAAALAAFIGLAAILQSVFGYRMGLGLDRSAILEPSFFSEARRIRERDPQAFVLFEPRKSADLYTSNQAFFGLRSVPTRELILQKARLLPAGNYDVTTANAIEFVEPADLAHTWTLRSQSAVRWPLLMRFPDKIPQMPYVYRWSAQRLADSPVPVLVLAGDTFERPYGDRNVGAVPSGRIATFNFMRNGIAALYLPAGRAAAVEVELQPREGGYAALEAEARQRVDRGELGPEAAMTADGNVVRISYRFAAAQAAALRIVARCKGEAFVSVKVDGKDTL
jgi:hypothetical protein